MEVSRAEGSCVSSAFEQWRGPVVVAFVVHYGVASITQSCGSYNN